MEITLQLLSTTCWEKIDSLISPNLGHYNWWCPLKFSFAHSCVILKVLYTVMSCVAERCYKIYIKNQVKQKDFDIFSNSTVQERSKIVELYKMQNIFPNIVFLWLLCAQQKMVISQQFKNPHTNTPWYLSQSECVELFYKKLHPTNSLNLVVQVSRIELVIFYPVLVDQYLKFLL